MSGSVLSGSVPASPSAPSAGARRSLLDRVGIGVSIACAVHCVLAALLAAAPAFAATAAPHLFASDGLGESLEWLETALLWIALGVGAFALVPAYLREHRRISPLVLFALGLGFVASVRAVESDTMEIVGTVSGVFLIASAHFVNLRSRHRHDAACCPH